MEDEARYLKEADRGNTCCPTCHVPEAVPLKTTTSVLEGLMMRPRAWQTLCMPSRRVWSPADVQDRIMTFAGHVMCPVKPTMPTQSYTLCTLVLDMDTETDLSKQGVGWLPGSPSISKPP